MSQLRQLCRKQAGWKRLRMRRPNGDEGMATAEYAVATVAAVAFAGILYKVVTSGAVQAALQAIVTRALSG